MIDKGLFGNITRRNVLGLTNAPEVMLDDNSSVAYFGTSVGVNMVDSESGEDGLGQPFALPLDVKTIGYTVLSQFGYTAEQQQLLLAAWLSESDTVKDDWTDQWNAVDKNDSDATNAFVNDLVTSLQAAA
jgi:hypothetical protein